MRRDVLRLIAFFCFILVLAAAQIIPSGLKPLFANGGTRPVVQNARVGPYELQVGIFPGSPKVGNLHLNILVKTAGSETPVTDATVMVAARGPEGATDVSPVRATNSTQSPQFYDVDIRLDMEGSWTLTLETDSLLGQASLDVPLEVTASGGLSLALLLAGAVAVVVLGMWLRDRFRARRRPRQEMD